MTGRVRRTEIRIETHEISILRPVRGASIVFCESCRAMVAAVSREQMAEFFELNEASIRRLMERDKCHLVETDGAPSVICGRSLMQQLMR